MTSSTAWQRSRHGHAPQHPAKSRENSGNRRNVGRRFRRGAEAGFDPARHGRHRMVEGIFGAKKTRGRRLHCRYGKKEMQERFGVLLATTRNARSTRSAAPRRLPSCRQPSRDCPA